MSDKDQVNQQTMITDEQTVSRLSEMMACSGHLVYVFTTCGHFQMMKIEESNRQISRL